MYVACPAGHPSADYMHLHIPPVVGGPAEGSHPRSSVWYQWEGGGAPSGFGAVAWATEDDLGRC